MSTNNTTEDEGITERFLRACSLVESNPQEAVVLLESLEEEVRVLALFSPNETIEDVSTKSLPFLALPHKRAMAFVSLPASPGQMKYRQSLVHTSCDLWAIFLGKLEQLELLTTEELKEHQQLLEELEEDDTGNGTMKMPPGPNRESKISRFKAQQQAKAEVERLKALRERRHRFEITAEEEMDGHDEESLQRTVALRQLSIQKSEALENWSQSKRELPMIAMMVMMEEERQLMQRHNGATPIDEKRSPPPLSGKPLQVTRITKDSGGQLQVKREEIKSKVFRPGWNQPTMSLEELGEREYHAAVEREANQKEAEAKRIHEPKRYEDLVRDGMEDNQELVDASAKLDRDWDDWKDENPRGSGNKMANRGDKNF